MWGRAERAWKGRTGQDKARPTALARCWTPAKLQRGSSEIGRASKRLQPESIAKIQRRLSRAPAWLHCGFSKAPARPQRGSSEDSAPLQSGSSAAPLWLQRGSSENPARLQRRSSEASVLLQLGSTEAPAKIQRGSSEDSALLQSGSSVAPLWLVDPARLE